MFRTMLKSKIHRAMITEANINYRGSITIDRTLMKAADLLPNEKVEGFNVYNGARFATYCIEAEPGCGKICLNGAAARLGQVGDIIIILAYGLMTEEEARSLQPKVVFVDDHNQIQTVSSSPAGEE
jgi:aspartate 1-decarboxylase